MKDLRSRLSVNTAKELKDRVREERHKLSEVRKLLKAR